MNELSMTGMNHYGRRAMDHMARHAPDRLAAMADPTTYFAELGELIAEQVLDLEQSLAAPAPEHESYHDRVGRLNMARLRAEEAVFAELVWPSLLEDESPTAATSDLGSRQDWDPLTAMLERMEHRASG